MEQYIYIALSFCLDKSDSTIYMAAPNTYNTLNSNIFFPAHLILPYSRQGKARRNEARKSKEPVKKKEALLPPRLHNRAILGASGGLRASVRAFERRVRSICAMLIGRWLSHAHCAATKKK